MTHAARGSRESIGHRARHRYLNTTSFFRTYTSYALPVGRRVNGFVQVVKCVGTSAAISADRGSGMNTPPLLRVPSGS